LKKLLFPKEIPPWIIDADDRRDYIEGWKARVDGKPRTDGPADLNSRWYNGWADVHLKAEGLR